MQTLKEFLHWCTEAPEGTQLDPHAIADVLQALAATRGGTSTESQPTEGSATWRERLWTAPAQTRLGTRELSEALGRPRSWIYTRTQSEALDPLPHRKLDGSLVFVAEEIRHWLCQREEVIEPGTVSRFP
jgi:predicted DNA-binding transcriptional regulator AlpA